MKYSNPLIISISLLLCLGLVTPALAIEGSSSGSAQTNASSSPIGASSSPQAGLAANARTIEACNKATNRLNEAVTKLNAEIAKKAQQRTNLDKKKNDQRTDADEQIEAANKKADQTRATKIEELKTTLNAETDTQKLAITNFQAAVSAAVTTRRETVKAADLQFRTALDSLIRTRQTSVDTALTNRLKTLQATQTEVTTMCATPANLSYDTLKSIFSNRNQRIEGTFDKVKNSSDSFGSSVKALTVTRKTAIENAKTKFQADMDLARTNLKAAFSLK